MTVWLIIWSVILGPEDPKLLRTVVEVTAGAEQCLALANQIGAAGRLDGNLVLEYSCVRERPRTVRREGLDT